MATKTTHNLTADVFTPEGKKSSTVSLPAAVFAAPRNDALVHQVVTSMMDNARTPVAHTKDRGDVRGGGKKPWRQKGTGRARHGSRRSPIWAGGGVTHGPLNVKSYERKINRKTAAAALRTVLAQKLRDGKVLFVTDLPFTEPKTAEAQRSLTALAGVTGFESLSRKKGSVALFALPERAEMVEKSFRNIGSVAVQGVRDLNALEALKAEHIVFVNPEASLPLLVDRIGNAKLAGETH